MRNLLAFLFVLSLYSCQTTGNEKDTIKSVPLTISDTTIEEYQKRFNKDNITDLSLDSSVVIYGKPLTCYDFTVNEGINPFRLFLYDMYNEEERARRTINMKEATWELDSAYRFTIWYEVLDDSTTVAKSSISYHKFTCF
ncbi:hypothetical protein L3049_14365 [Labilibaculum sp. DW002]|uniref:Lipoprotein n=1 Tax=Paralabilibaculum antarcticum TaxID=2912572 RepID=A0ABT5VUT2_9BACT|nr:MULTISPECIES: hypothetical protein [unclassified Labilibaculum]MBI9060200.1 hypothetical protein [Labilibaculum sp.]MDE5419181.1 hypothetical protein [Labilibaculum sp. DW002]